MFATFARNSLVRDMTFRANFLIDAVSSLAWMLMNLGFYELIFMNTAQIGAQSAEPATLRSWRFHWTAK